MTEKTKEPHRDQHRKRGWQAHRCIEKHMWYNNKSIKSKKRKKFG